MTFSADGYSSPNYHVEVARADNAEGPYERYVGEQFLHTDDNCQGDECPFEGPGHGSVVELNNDEWWFVYHSWIGGSIGRDPPGRNLLVDKIIWDDDGWPYIGSPSATPQDVPNV